jgi:hypothetical protein
LAVAGAGASERYYLSIGSLGSLVSALSIATITIKIVLLDWNPTGKGHLNLSLFHT